MEARLQITGVRSIVHAGKARWLLMELEGESVRPYLPVIVNEMILRVAMPLVQLSVC